MIFSCERDVEPHASQGGIEDRVIGRAFECVAQRDDRQVRAPGPRLGKRHGDLSLDMIAIEARNGLELRQLVGAAAGARMELGQFLSRGDEVGRERHRLFKRLLRLGHSALVAECQAEHVIRVRHPLVESNRLPRGHERGIEVAVAIPRERQLVGHARRSLVQLQAGFIHFSSDAEPLALVHHVAELIERTRGRRIESGSRPEIADGLVDFASSLIRFAAAQVRQHRIGTQRHRAAIGLERHVGLIVAERRIAPSQERAVIALAGGSVVGDGGAHRGHNDQERHQQRALHRAAMVTGLSGRAPGQVPFGTFRVFRGLNWL